LHARADKSAVKQAPIKVNAKIARRKYEGIIHAFWIKDTISFVANDKSFKHVDLLEKFLNLFLLWPINA